MANFYEFYDALRGVDRDLGAGKAAAEGHKTLVELLDRQEREVRAGSGKFGLTLYAPAKYAMAALGDEILLRHADAHDKPVWTELLESALFHSQRAGEKVFDDIEKVQDFGVSTGELARVYLAVLALGFQGVLQYREDEIRRHRRRLFTLACGDPMLDGKRPVIAPAAYASTVTTGAKSTLPHLRPWIYAIVLLVLLYIVAGAAMWYPVARELDPLVDRVVAAPPPEGSAP